MITYQTERLILTPVRPEHEPELFKLHNDPAVQEGIFRNVPQTIEDVREWLDWYLGQWRKNGVGTWIVYEKSKDGPTFIGRCGLSDYEGTNDLEQATALAGHAVGRGLGAEASRFTITHALQNSAKEKIVILIKHGNARAERGAKKFGWRYIDSRWYKGKFWRYYEMTREEFFSQAHNSLAGCRTDVDGGI
ncbi:GNAT family N-acetyltransferase [Bradyrhizobium sp. 168]|uniref:GNAT family N-acetyltransferase n=1 Tax=Bradyrhizobium sp. 168 TaxID=2782639 RepID=UPI001FFB81F5|nr:GNAT family protein [Bradyrhizobium sp. 168]MCK1583956.1 GNAT family N-acetyltransferase [Bradyrhizobium sp. 168]